MCNSTHHFLYLLQFGYVDLQIFIPFEFILHWHNVLCVSDFTFVSFFKILLELIKLCPQPFSFILDFIQLPANILIGPKAILLNDSIHLTLG